MASGILKLHAFESNFMQNKNCTSKSVQKLLLLPVVFERSSQVNFGNFVRIILIPYFAQLPPFHHLLRVKFWIRKCTKTGLSMHDLVILNTRNFQCTNAVIDRCGLALMSVTRALVYRSVSKCNFYFAWNFIKMHVTWEIQMSSSQMRCQNKRN